MSIDTLNRFVRNPITMDMPRSRFKRPFDHKTTFKSGKLIPIFCDEVLPGDTFDIKWSSVVRMLTPAVPVMDNAFLDMYFFFVPNRLCTFGKDDWPKIVGENINGFWAPSSEATVYNTSNSILLTNRTVASQSVANYLGLPIGSYSSTGFNDLPVSLLPFNAYIKIWNEWFRDQNTQAPKSILYSGSGDTNNYFSDCLDVNKLHDLYTSCLPAPQKGNSVLLPLGVSAPVYAGDTEHHLTSTNGMKVRLADGSTVPSKVPFAADGSNNVGAADNTTFAGQVVGTPSPVHPTNLYADLANATAASINEMRQAFAIQRLLEADARGGTRFRSILKAHFGVTIPDLTVQVPEYLGGKRIPLNITQVLATAQDSNNNVPLGKTGAFSNTSFSDFAFRKSFTEWGFIMGVCCVRTEQSYSQGIPKMFTRNRRYDWYWSKLANIGEQPIMTRELYVSPSTSTANYLLSQVFGYQEAWADYRFKPNMVTGNLAPNANDTTLTAWTYTNKFVANPVLNSTFMVQPSTQIGNTLVDTTTNQQFVGDFYFDLTCTREMPLYSIPGLIDHH